MSKFVVLFEQHVRHQVEVDAASYEDAVDVATSQVASLDRHRVVATKLTPTWIAAAAPFAQTDEFEHEVIGSCAECKAPIVSREIPGQPWAYTTQDKTGDPVCYACRKGEP